MKDEYQRRLTLQGLSYLVYCKRRYYLAYIENLPQYNLFVELGTQAHEDVHKSQCIKISDGYQMTNYTVFSDVYDLIGICDMVEFLRSDDGVDIDFLNDRFQIVPIEYKLGKKRKSVEYIAQVVGQAMCLEEMFHCKINTACIYFTDSKERWYFEITNYYRNLVVEAVQFVRDYDLSVIPPEYKKRCKNCSLFDVCNPRDFHVSNYVDALWEVE